MSPPSCVPANLSFELIRLADRKNILQSIDQLVPKVQCVFLFKMNGGNLAGRPAEVPGTHIIFSPDILHGFSGIAAHVDADGFFRISVKHDPPMLQNDTPVTQLTDRLFVSGRKIAFDEKEYQIPVLPQFIQLQVEPSGFGCYNGLIALHFILVVHIFSRCLSNAGNS